MLATEQRLKNAPIVIIISPGWFESKDSRGTSSEVLLEYFTENFQKNVLKGETDTELHQYLYKRIAQLYNEFNSPGLELKLMNFKYLASKSFIHKAVYAPLIFFDNYLISLKEKLVPRIIRDNELFNRLPIFAESVKINWDSLYTVSREEVLRESTNNKMGFANDIFTKNIHGERGGFVEAVNEKYNQELEDFKMLMKLLKEKKVNASFIVAPLNPIYFKNIKAIIPIIKTITNEIKYYGFNFLNLMETDPNKYDKAMLRDAMHMTDYAWYKIDHFIVDTYKLSK